jgi:hypothetical protein
VARLILEVGKCHGLMDTFAMLGFSCLDLVEEIISPITLLDNNINTQKMANPLVMKMDRVPVVVVVVVVVMVASENGCVCVLCDDVTG